LPNAAPGKGFAECKVAFAGCIRHPAKRLNPVVLLPTPKGPPAHHIVEKRSELYYLLIFATWIILIEPYISQYTSMKLISTR